MADLDAILADHAHCEKKAAATALSLLNRYPHHSTLVERMAALAEEEIQHFSLVFAVVRERGKTLPRDDSNIYVNRLREHVRKGEPQRLQDSLLVAALIEARSCERFSLLAEALPEGRVKALFTELIPSEAGHYALFLKLARELTGEEETERRFDELLDIEAEIVSSLPGEARIHG